MEKNFLVKVVGLLGGDEQDLRKGDGIRLEVDPQNQEISSSELEQDVRGLSL